MKSLLHSTKANPSLSPVVHADLSFAEGLISQVVTSSSWSRNSRWIRKFYEYVLKNCHAQLQRYGAERALTSKPIATAFLASVVSEDPQAHTRVVVTKRSINLLRALAKKSSLDDNIAIKYLARGVKKAIVRTKRQSPVLLVVYVAAMKKWGNHNVWWR